MAHHVSRLPLPSLPSPSHAQISIRPMAHNDPSEHGHRGLFHRHKNPEDEVLVTETTDVQATEIVSDGKHDSKIEIKHHARKEHIGEAAALVGGAFALYEKHQAKKDPENAHKHHIAEAVAGAVAVGSGAYALHERHDKKDAEKEAKHHV